VQQLFASVLLSQWSDQGKAMIQLVVLVWEMKLQRHQIMEIMLWNLPLIKTKYEDLQKARHRIFQLYVCNLPKAYFSWQSTISTNGRRIHFFMQIICLASIEQQTSLSSARLRAMLDT
jgi:hypothetical protein